MALFQLLLLSCNDLDKMRHNFRLGQYSMDDLIEDPWLPICCAVESFNKEQGADTVAWVNLVC